MALPTSAVEWHVVLLAHAAALLLLGAWRQLLSWCSAANPTHAATAVK